MLYIDLWNVCCKFFVATPIFGVALCNRYFSSSRTRSICHVIHLSHSLKILKLMRSNYSSLGVGKSDIIAKNLLIPAGTRICTLLSQKPDNEAYLLKCVDRKLFMRVYLHLFRDQIYNNKKSAMAFSLLGTSRGFNRCSLIRIYLGVAQVGPQGSYMITIAIDESYGETGVDELVAELERSSENASGPAKNNAGSVGILVRDPSKPPPKMKLVAKRGRLEVDSEEVGVSPNGTEFVISIRDAPELDKSTLVIGRVVDGMDVVERISQVKTVQENSSSPYFRVAKLIGDKRAIVAERGFNRPYSKIVITNCGLID
ncbi:hypothetical protein Sjap_024341 [Stephania japonica]|uniref:PPIase cyclophilin-type domain-containing protein n=1 Tax=Stephania japonica TaxID=461633 RepID=A0AAP0ELV5_9MAGN